jgi:hypothetical protein
VEAEDERSEARVATRAKDQVRVTAELDSRLQRHWGGVHTHRSSISGVRDCGVVFRSISSLIASIWLNGICFRRREHESLQYTVVSRTAAGGS